MRLGIFCNFGPPNHCGGSEEVIKQVSHGLPDDYKVKIYSYNEQEEVEDRGVVTVPCLKGDSLISQINENDHILVYSDSFWGWETIVKNIDRIDPKVSVALVGAYYMREQNTAVAEIFKNKSNKFNIISHSKLNIDYKWCLDNGLHVNIVPNGVDLLEFDSNCVDFRKKYGIKEKYILLNVSNFFFGKGQEVLSDIGYYLNRSCIRDDYVIVQISSTVNYLYDSRFLKSCKEKNKRNRVNSIFLRDIPRDDVVSAFKNSGVFLFTSRKEICPLVILESQAAGLPWISMEVGNVNERQGGRVIGNAIEDDKGYKRVGSQIASRYSDEVVNILKKDNCQLSVDGRRSVGELDWRNIISEYDRIFNV